MGRKFFVGGNWKMNGTKSEINDIVGFLKKGPLDSNVGMFKEKILLFFYIFNLCFFIILFITFINCSYINNIHY